MKKIIIMLVLVFSNSLIFSQGIFDKINKRFEERQKNEGFSKNQISLIKKFNKLNSEGIRLKNNQDYKEAITKFSKAIEIIDLDRKVNNYVNGENEIYYERGDTYYQLANNGSIYSQEANYWNAIHDFKRYINSNDYKSSSTYLSLCYLLRGISYENLKRKNQACSDYNNAKKLGLKRADDLLDELNCE